MVCRNSIVQNSASSLLLLTITKTECLAEIWWSVCIIIIIIIIIKKKKKKKKKNRVWLKFIWMTCSKKKSHLLRKEVVHIVTLISLIKKCSSLLRFPRQKQHGYVQGWLYLWLSLRNHARLHEVLPREKRTLQGESIFSIQFSIMLLRLWTNYKYIRN